MSGRELMIGNVSISYPKHSKFGNRGFFSINLFHPISTYFSEVVRSKKLSCCICICKPSISKPLFTSGCKYMKRSSASLLLATVLCFKFQLRSWDGSIAVRRAELRGRVVPQFLMTFSGNVFFFPFFFYLPFLLLLNDYICYTYKTKFLWGLCETFL